MNTASPPFGFNAPSTSLVPPRAFVAFSGGGARGLVHVGALKALEDHGLHVCGVAGTSAGAIVATLCAAGFSADDIVNSNGKHSIFDRLRKIDPRFVNATAIFGQGGWSKIACLRQARRHMTWPRAAVGALLCMVLILAAVWSCAHEGRWGWVIGAALLTIPAASLGVGLRILYGLARLDEFEYCLRRLLQEELFPDEPGRIVRFSDFGRDGRPTLKIVATNLTRQSLQLFSPATTGSVSVSQATAASICLPFIFEPWRIDGEVYVDGGIVSNLPAWPFDDEREIDPGALTLAFDIESASRKAWSGHFTWPIPALTTAISGAATLNTRGMLNAETFVLKSGLELLNFDMKRSDAADQVRVATTAARSAINKSIFINPSIYRSACNWALSFVTQALEAAPVVYSRAEPNARIRVGIAMRDTNGCGTLRLRFGAGYLESDADVGILLPLEGSVVGAAWRNRGPWLERRPFDRQLNLPGRTNDALRQRIWKQLAWTLCVPIYGNGDDSPAFVVTIDGSRPLSGDDEMIGVMAKLAREVERSFADIVASLSKADIAVRRGK